MLDAVGACEGLDIPVSEDPESVWAHIERAVLAKDPALRGKGAAVARSISETCSGPSIRCPGGTRPTPPPSPPVLASVSGRSRPRRRPPSPTGSTTPARSRHRRRPRAHRRHSPRSMCRPSRRGQRPCPRGPSPVG
jgi:hypothetical protein